MWLDCHLVVHLVGELFLKHYVNPFRCWFHTSVFHPIILLKETFGPLRLLGATLVCIAQTIISYPFNLFLSGKYTGVYRPNYFDKHHTGGRPPVGM